MGDGRSSWFEQTVLPIFRDPTAEPPSPFMIVSTYLTADSVLIHPQVTDKGDVIRMLVSHLPGIDTSHRDAIAQAVIEREEVMSTGVGNGIAIPHAKVELLDSPVVAFALLDQPVDFSSFDGRPVDLIFLVAGSVRANSLHLKMLSALSRLLIHQKTVDGLRSSKSPEDVLEQINQAELHVAQP